MHKKLRVLLVLGRLTVLVQLLAQLLAQSLNPVMPLSRPGFLGMVHAWCLLEYSAVSCHASASAWDPGHGPCLVLVGMLCCVMYLLKRAIML